MATDKQHTTLNVPTLRFPEFSGEWGKTQLGRISQLSKGCGISKEQRSEVGNPCILYGELYTKYTSEVINEVYSRTDIDQTNLVKSVANDVIIPSSGETAIDISTARCVPFDDILLGGDLNIIRLKNGYDGKFFAYQLNGVRKTDIAKIAQGVSVVHLYGDGLKKLCVSYPTKAEQNKIASMLALIDERIATQKKVIEKLQSLIGGIYKSIFADIDCSFRLDEICEIRKGQQVNGTELLEDGEYYVMNGGVEPSGCYDKFNTPANTISISEGGNSCGYVQFNNRPFWSGGHCYTLRNVNLQYNLRFLYHYLKANESVIMKLRIGSGLPNIQKKDLAAYCVPDLDIDKQIAIAKSLDAVQTKIELSKNLLDSYERQKMYLLSTMFI